MISKEELLKRNNSIEQIKKEFESKLDEELLKTNDVYNDKVCASLWGSYPNYIIEEVLDKYIKEGNYTKYEYKETFDRCSFTKVILYL